MLSRRVGTNWDEPFAKRAPRLVTFALAAVSPLALLAALPQPIAFVPAAIAQDANAARASGTQEAGWGRIRFDFAEPVDVVARADNGVLVVRFSQPVQLTERLVDELPGYVGVVRRDPDGTGLRAALSQNFSANVLPAGSTVFVDLLPEAWSGMPPGLPSEIVAELARLAREAEARFAAEQAARAVAETAPLPVRVAELPGLTRLVFDPPPGTRIDAQNNDGEVALFFDARLDLAPERPLATVPGIAGVTPDDTGEALYVRIALEDGFTARGFREDGGFVLDIEPLDVATPEAEGADPVRAALGLSPFVPVEEPPPEAVAVETPAPPAASPPVATAPASAAPPVRDAARPAPPPREQSVAPVVTAGDEGLRILFPFPATTSAAAFERAGTAFVVFQTSETLAEPVLDEAARAHAELLSVVREGPFVTARFRLPEPRLVRLVPDEEGWALTVGGPPSEAPDPIDVRPIVDDDGRAVLELALLDATGVHWTEIAGERLAVVVAPGPARHLAATRRFVEVDLLPTAHGAVVAALADDVTVRADLDGVHVGRGDGLAIALPGVHHDGEEAGPDIPLVLAREPWMEAQMGSLRDTHRALLQAIVEAPTVERTDERIDYARALLAAGLATEASGALEYAVAEDGALATDERIALLRGVLALRRHRLEEADALLHDPILQEQQEAILWRALLDAERGRWRQALTGFRRSERVIARYADDLQGEMRLAAARAAIAERDFGYADDQLSRVAMLYPGAVPEDELDYVRATFDRDTGRTEFALSEFERLAETGSRPVAARAELDRITLALETGRLTGADAIPALETLSMVWRGDDVEIRALGMLGRLYAEEGLWRQAFFTAHTANRIFPDHPVTLALHEETAHAFDALFLEGRGADLDEVEALALFFDFREFLPIGRRGDEIVRRLADRLVALGLLDKAAELLTHQVENRLEGAGRAAVAARLATIHLMNRHPADALTIIDRTRIAELPRSVRRARNLIEARALSDLSRTDLALEVIADEEGPEIDRLRADIQWTGRRWREAGEAHERLAGTVWQDATPLSEDTRSDVLRAALAYSLAQDRIGLDRLRAKFADKMNESEDAPTFALLSDPDALTTSAFREAARTVSNEDGLERFLRALEDTHPQEALRVTPMVEPGGRAEDAPAEAAPAEAAAPTPEASLTSETGVL